jgi:hypothetical protein
MVRIRCIDHICARGTAKNVLIPWPGVNFDQLESARQIIPLEFDFRNAAETYAPQDAFGCLKEFGTFYSLDDTASSENRRRLQ